MVDLLTRYLQGSDSEAVNKGKNPFTSYMSNYNVDPYWNPYLKLADGKQAIAPTNPLTQAPTGGINNPYAMQQPQAPVEQPMPQDKLGELTIKSFMGNSVAPAGGEEAVTTDRWMIGAGGNPDIELSNGRVIPFNVFQQLANKTNFLSGKESLKAGDDITELARYF